MSWSSFTFWIQKYLSKLGWNVKRLKDIGDFGIDLILESHDKRIGVQVKHRSNVKERIGIDAIQQAYSGSKFYNCDEARVITNTYYTKHAKELAKKLNVKIISRPTILWMLSKRPGEVINDYRVRKPKYLLKLF